MPLEAKQREYVDKIIAYRKHGAKAKAEQQQELGGLSLEQAEGANETYKLRQNLAATGRLGDQQTQAGRAATSAKAEAHRIDVLNRVEDGINVGRISEKEGQASAAEHKLARQRIVDAPVLPGEVADTAISKAGKEAARDAMQKQRAAEELIHTMLDAEIRKTIAPGEPDKEKIRKAVQAAIDKLIHDHVRADGVLSHAFGPNGMIKNNGDYWLAHFVSRHGPQTTRDDQVTRVVTGHPADAPRGAVGQENVALAAGANADIDAFANKGNDWQKTSSRFVTASSELFAVEESLSRMHDHAAAGGVALPQTEAVLVRKAGGDTDLFGKQYKIAANQPPNVLSPAVRAARAAQVSESPDRKGVKVAVRESPDGSYAPVTAFAVDPAGADPGAAQTTIGNFNAATGVTTPHAASSLAALKQTQRTQAIADAQDDFDNSQAAAQHAETEIESKANDLQTAIDTREALTGGKALLETLAQAKVKAQTAAAVKARLDLAVPQLQGELTAAQADLKLRLADIKVKRGARDTSAAELKTSMTAYDALVNAANAADLQAKSLAARKAHEAFVHCEQGLRAAQQRVERLTQGLPGIVAQQTAADVKATEAADHFAATLADTQQKMGSAPQMLVIDEVVKAAQAEVDAAKALSQTQKDLGPDIAKHTLAAAQLEELTRQDQVATHAQGEQGVLDAEVAVAKAQDLQDLKDAAAVQGGESPADAKARLDAEVKKRADEIALVEKELIAESIAERAKRSGEQRDKAVAQDAQAKALQGQVNDADAQLQKLLQLAKIKADGPKALDKDLAQAKKKVLDLQKAKEAIDAARLAREQAEAKAQQAVEKAEAKLGALPSAATKDKQAAATQLADRAGKQPAVIAAAARRLENAGKERDATGAAAVNLRSERDAAAALKAAPSAPVKEQLDQVTVLENEAVAAERAARDHVNVVDKQERSAQSEVSRLTKLEVKAKAVQTAADKQREAAEKALVAPREALEAARKKVESLTAELAAAQSAEEPDAKLVGQLGSKLEAARGEVDQAAKGLEPLLKVFDQRADEAKTASDEAAKAGEAVAKASDAAAAEQQRLAAEGQSLQEKAVAARATVVDARAKAKAARAEETKRANADLLRLEKEVKEAEREAAMAVNAAKAAEREHADEVAAKEGLDKQAAAARAEADAASASERTNAEIAMRDAKATHEGAAKDLQENQTDEKATAVEEALAEANQRVATVEAAKDEAANAAALVTDESIAQAKSERAELLDQARSTRRAAAEAQAVAEALAVEANERTELDQANVAMAKAELACNAAQARVASQGGAVTPRAQAEQDLAEAALELAKAQTQLAELQYAHAGLVQKAHAAKRAHVERLRDLKEANDLLAELAAAVDPDSVARRNDLQAVRIPRLTAAEVKAKNLATARQGTADAKKLELVPAELLVGAMTGAVEQAEQDLANVPP